ncbi:MAG: TspO/MBR family protein [Clostridia bacterium]
MRKNIKTYIVSIIIALGAGGISALISKNNMDLYSEINQPSLAPPASVFPVVWTVLFLLMGISSAIIYSKAEEKPTAVRKALQVYGLQLAVNFLWSIIFFNLRIFWFAFFWLIFLWTLIIMMIYKFRKISPAAAYMQIPYLLWVTFAGYLTFMVAAMN